MKSERFLRTEAVLGKPAVEKLKSSFVVIAGLGGVGGYALEALARMGVMHFRVIDSDCFEESNLNRQILSLDNNISSRKTDVAEERIHLINPDAEVEKMFEFVDSSNIDRALSGNPDIVIDAIDSVPSKCLLITECVKRNIKAVSSMGAALRRNPCLVRTDTVARSFGCALAKQVRNGIEDKTVLDKVKCVFSPEHCSLNEDGMLGSLPTVVGVFGLALAQLAVDELTLTENR